MRFYGDLGELAELTESVLLENKDAMINRICRNQLSQEYGQACFDEGDSNDPFEAIEELASEAREFFREHPEFDNRVDWNQYNKISITDLWHKVREFKAEIRNRVEAGRNVINPDRVPEFTDRRDEGNGIVTYQVQDDADGMMAVRRVVDSHWGEDKNPWCLISRGVLPEWAELYGGDEDSWKEECDYCEPDMAGAYEYWTERYNGKPKRIAFLHGRLLAFMAVEPVELSDPEGRFSESEARRYFPKLAKIFDNDPELQKMYEGVAGFINSGDADQFIDDNIGKNGWGETTIVGDAVPDTWYGRNDEPYPSLYSLLRNYGGSYEKYRSKA